MKLATALAVAKRTDDPELVIYRARNGEYMVGRIGSPHIGKESWRPADFVALHDPAKRR